MSTILVPDYIYPSGNAWEQYTGSFPTCSMLVANPSNGPGCLDSNYTMAIKNARDAGLQVLGYVYTCYAVGGLTAVKEDIDNWYRFYTIDGIFFDQVKATTENFNYYHELHDYVKAKNGARNFVALNPGTTPDENYMTISDTCSIYENSYTNWQSTNPYAAWMAKYSPPKLTIFVYSIPDTQAALSVINKSKTNNVGRFFLTDQSGYTVTPSQSFWKYIVDTIPNGV